jgi:hypothetical protein
MTLTKTVKKQALAERDAFTRWNRAPLLLITSLANQESPKPLTTETQRHRENHKKDFVFLCVSVSLWLMVLVFVV